MYRINDLRLSVKSFANVSVREFIVVGIAVSSTAMHATRSWAPRATLEIRLGVFVLSGVVYLAGLLSQSRYIVNSNRDGLSIIALPKSCTGRLIAALLMAPSLLNATASPPSPATVVALDPKIAAGVGARLGFVEYEAENGTTNARIVGPDVAFTTLASEASGRRAVLLEAERDFVEFTLSAAANALTVRYAVPDGPDAGISDAVLGVFAHGKRIADLPVTSRYCCYYGRYPFTKNAADGNGHHFFDHARTRLDRVLPAGTVVRLMRSSEMKSAGCAIDLVDFELVPAPRKQPPHSLSVVDFGADRRGASDSREAFSKAIAAASSAGRALWIPPGHFRLDGHLEVDRVEIAVAGVWFSRLQVDGVGLFGRNAPLPSQAGDLYDLPIH